MPAPKGSEMGVSMMFISSFNIFLGTVIIIVLLVVINAIKILREYERGVVFSLGRFTSVKGPGIIFVIPVIQQVVRVDLRVITMDVPSQDVISRDNVSVQVNAVLYFRVVAPEKAIIQVERYLEATSQLAQTTLRAVLGKHELDEMLSEREKLNADVQQILDAQTDSWGIKVTNVEIKHIDLNENMIRAIARQAEAERERRAKVIHAEGERQAAQALMEAAAILAIQPSAMQLRYLQTLTQVAGDKSSTLVFPIPVDLLSTLIGKNGAGSMPGMQGMPSVVPGTSTGGAGTASMPGTSSVPGMPAGAPDTASMPGSTSSSGASGAPGTSGTKDVPPGLGEV